MGRRGRVTFRLDGRESCIRSELRSELIRKGVNKRSWGKECPMERKK